MNPLGPLREVNAGLYSRRLWFVKVKTMIFKDMRAVGTSNNAPMETDVQRDCGLPILPIVPIFSVLVVFS